MKFRRFGLALLVPMVAAGGACGVGEDPADSDTLVIAAPEEPQTLNSLYRSAPADDLATWSVNEGLVNLTPEGEIVPVLATEVPTLVEGDNLRWRVKLREGIEFSNGTPLDADVVVRNIEMLLKPENPEDADSTLLGILDTLVGAEKVDEHTVDLVTETPDVDFPYKLTLLRIVEPDATTAEKAVGTGPYMMESWERGQSIEFQANDDYWGDQAAQIDSVELRFIADGSTRSAALQSGEVDIAADLTVDQAQAAPHFITSTNAVESMVYRLNQSQGPMADPNFRRALNYAVDKEALNEALFGGTLEPLACQTVSSQSTTFNDTLSAYPYDPEKAKELLSQVDVPANYELTLTADNGGLNTEARELTLAVADYIRRVGVPVKTGFIDTPTYLEDLVDFAGDGTADEQARETLYVTSDDAYNSALRFVQQYMVPEGRNATVGEGYDDLTPAITDAQENFDTETRKGLLDLITKVACDDAFFLYLLEKKPVYGMANDVAYEPGYGELARMNFADASLK